MIDNTFFRSYKLVPEVNRPFLYSSLIAMAATLIRMIGPQLISRGIMGFLSQTTTTYSSKVFTIF